MPDSYVVCFQQPLQRFVSDLYLTKYQREILPLIIQQAFSIEVWEQNNTVSRASSQERPHQEDPLKPLLSCLSIYPDLGPVHTYTITSTSLSAWVRENMKSKAYLCEAFKYRRVLHESELRAIPTRTSPICSSHVFRQLIQVLFVYIVSTNTSDAMKDGYCM